MSDKIGVRLEAEGEKAFRDSLAAVNAQIKTMGAEMDAVAAQFAKNANSEEALVATNNVLGKSMEAAGQKVALLRKEISSQQEYLDALGKTLDEVSAEFGENSEQALKAQNAYNRQVKKVSDLQTQLNKTEASMARMKQATEDNAQALEHMGESADDAIDGEKAFDASLKAVNAQIEAMGAEMDAVAAQFAKNANSEEALVAKNNVLGKSMEAAGQKVALLRKEISSQQEYLDALGKTLDEVSAEFGENSAQALKAQNAYNQQAKKVSDLQTQLNKTEASMARMEQATEDNAQALEHMGESADDAIDGIDQLAAALAAAGVAKGVQEIADALVDCVGTFSNFESQMSAVGSISGATGEELEELADKAKEMGATTSFTATEAAEAFEYMAMAGWKSEDMLSGLEGVMNLAAASGEDLAAVSDIVTDALTAFGLQASDSAHFADVLAKASSNSNTNVAMMGETFKYVAPVAGALGYSIEDTAIAIGLMANAGIKSTQAGTALRSIMTKLAKPTDEVAAYMDKLGISMTDDSGQMRTLSELIDMLRQSFAGLTEAQRAEYAAGLAGQEAMSGLLAIVNAAEGDYDKLSLAIENCSGAAYEMSQVKLDNLSGQMTLLESAADGLKLAIGEQLAPALQNLAEAGTDAFTWATEFVEDNPWVVDAVVGLTTALGALALGVGALSAGPKIIAALNTALGLLAAHPIVALAAGLAGVAAALATFSARSEEGTAAQKALAKSMKESKKAYEDLAETMGEERASTQTTIQSLLDLLAVENKSAAQKEVIAQKVAELNEAIPNLGLAYDAMGDSINMSADALERMAADAAAQGEHEVQVSRLNELYSQQSQLAGELATAEANLEEARASGSSSVQLHQMVVNSLTEAMADNEEQIAELEDAINSYSDSQSNAIVQTGDMSAVADALRVEIEGLQAAYDESRAKALESINDQVGLFQELDGSAKTSIDSLIETLKGQVSYMDTYAENIQKAMELGVDEGLVRTLSDGSQESAQILAAIVQGGEEDIAALNEQFARVEEGKNNFADTVAQMEADFDAKMDDLVQDLDDAIDAMNQQDEAFEIGVNNIKGLIDGAASMERELVNQYSLLGRESLRAYKATVDQHSPSREFREAGSYDVQGLIGGAEDERENLKNTYIDLAETATLGVAEGITNSSDKAVKAAESTAKEVYSRNKEWMDRQTKYLDLSLQEQIALWEAIQGQFVEGSEQYAEAEEKIFDLRQKAQDEWYDALKESIDNRVKYERISLREQLTLWENVQRQFAQKSKQYAAAEEKIFDLRMQLQDEYYDKVKETNEKINQLNQEYYDQLNQRTTEISDSYGLFDKVAEREEVSGEELTRNLWDQIGSIEHFYRGLDELSDRGVSFELVEELRAMGVGASDELDALLNMTDDELSKYDELFWRKMNLASEIAHDELRNLRQYTNREIESSLQELARYYDENAPDVGRSFMESLADGIRSGMDDVVGASVDVMNAALDAAVLDFAANSVDVTAGIQNGSSSGTEQLVDRLTQALGGRSGGTCGCEISMQELEAAIRRAMDGMEVSMNGRRVGQVITAWQNNENRSFYL